MKSSKQSKKSKNQKNKENKPTLQTYLAKSQQSYKKKPPYKMVYKKLLVSRNMKKKIKESKNQKIKKIKKKTYLTNLPCKKPTVLQKKNRPTKWSTKSC